MVTILACIVFGGGAAYAASHLSKNSVGSKQLKRNAITTAKIKDQAVTGAKIKDGAITGSKFDIATLGVVPSAAHANNATSATNANALGGQPASAFASSTAVRDAVFGASGTVDTARSKGIAQANVTLAEGGEYCIDGLNPAPSVAVAQFAFGAANSGQIYVGMHPETGLPCAGSQIGILILQNGKDAPAPFMLVVF